METSASPQPPLLQLIRCTIRFGGLTAVSDLDLEIGSRELLGLIGPNGAGKTTVFNLITGVYQPTEGNIHFNGHSIVGQRPHEIAEHGAARTLSRCSTCFNWVASATHRPRACLMETNGGLKLSGPWPLVPSCCCWTSR